MGRFKFGRRGTAAEGGTAAPETSPAVGASGDGRPARRRTPMGQADARASDNLLVGLGVGLITVVTGLSAAGTFTAINAMNRQSEESLAETARYQEELARREQEANQGGPGNVAGPSGTVSGQDQTDVRYPEDPDASPSSGTTGTPVQGDMMTREQFMAELPEQVRWMIEKGITYDEYGLPRDEYGSLMNDPTTDIYDPARWAYFFDKDNEEKLPKKDTLPTQSEIDSTGEADGDKPVSELPVIAPDRDNDDISDHYDPDSTPIQNPAVEQVPGGSQGDNSGGDAEDPSGNRPVTAPDVDRPAPAGEGWWKDSDGKPIDGLSVDENGDPYYVVKPGDSLDSISRKYGFSRSDVVTASDIENPNVLYVGDIIRFPEAGPTGTPETGTKAPATETPDVVTGNSDGGEAPGRG